MHLAEAWVTGRLDPSQRAALLSPVAIGPVLLPNRIVMSAMGTRLGHEDGGISEEQIAYYARRARGGAAALVVEGSSVHPEGTTYLRKPRLYHDRYITGLERLARAIEQAGSVPGIQLMHAGRHASAATRSGPAFGAGGALSKATGQWSEPLDVEGIRDVIDAFGTAAERAAMAGFRILEIHAAHGYLLHDFLSPLTNDRTDDWGIGDRTRLLREVVARVRDRASDATAIVVRLSGFEPDPGGIDRDDAIEAAMACESAGADGVWVSAGNNDSLEWVVPPVFMPRGLSLDTARAVRERLGIPVGVVGRISTPQLAAEAIRGGSADVVLLGRALLADPDFVEKLRADSRDTSAIRPCIACNECLAQHLRDEPILCTVNPVAGRELEERRADHASERPRRLLVVGGGPAGMLFSTVAARRGHEVTLIERQDRTGGKVWLAAAAPYKQEEMLALLAALESDLRATTADVRVGVPDVQDVVDDLVPDVVVLSTGAWPREDPLLDDPVVSQAEDFLARPDASDWRRVAVIGAGDTACDAAARLATMGISVWMLARGHRMARGIEPVSSRELRRYLQRLGVEVHFGCAAVRVHDGSVVYEREGITARLDVDHVLLARGVDSSATSLTAGLRLPENVEVVEIGDARDPGNFLTSLRSAWDAAVSV